MKLKSQELYLSKKVGKAITDYRMLSEGDRIAVAVSGGVDSLTMLKILNDRRSFVPIKYETLAVHIDLGYRCIHPKILSDYFERNGYKYHIERVDILKGTTRKNISCFWCSWNRRKTIFEVAAKNNCNKVALGHHKDDIIQTILLNLFFHGEISAMSPRQELFEGRLTIIRPLAYVEKREITRFAKSTNFPCPKCKCPNSAISNRTRIAKIINDLRRVCPEVKTNIFRSTKRIKKEYLL
jgi:tRNA 2-thiocytidine biosynthesis protein TtcA